MIFVFKRWDDFCLKLQENGITSIPACEVTKDSVNYLVLKHDVETNVKRAYKLAQIEKNHGHRGSYYVQAYLLENTENLQLLKKMQQMGHEISYHYDVMDSCKGDLNAAICEFDENRQLFEMNGFKIDTVCQHGNPIVERIGYHSNRDFFRNPHVRERYPEISDIMVNYKEQVSTEFLYFSDAGRMFQQIADPINNDIVNNDDENLPLADLDELMNSLSIDHGNIISIHPHRWTKSALVYIIKAGFFKIVKKSAKAFAKVPFLKRIMSRYYYLAKKI